MNFDIKYNKRFLSNGERLLENFYAKRQSLEPLVFVEDVRKEAYKQKALKKKLSGEYIRLLKENNFLRDFINNYHVNVKGKRIHSVLDKLKTNRNGHALPDIFDDLHKKISNSPAF